MPLKKMRRLAKASERVKKQPRVTGKKVVENLCLILILFLKSMSSSTQKHLRLAKTMYSVLVIHSSCHDPSFTWGLLSTKLKKMNHRILVTKNPKKR